MKDGSAGGRQVNNDKIDMQRRGFLKASGAAVIVATAWLPGRAGADGTVYPASRGYLVVDPKKCQGCATCMLACSLVHHGRENPSLARIQMVQDPYGKWPDDVQIAQCRQCVEPGCVPACPRAAVIVDEKHGNVRTVEEKKCKRLRQCIIKCNFQPSRMVWNFEDRHSQKCDLCADTPYWNEKGGPGGKQACVEMCPVKAIKFVIETPVQKGDAGYYVDLRGAAWRKMGFPED